MDCGQYVDRVQIVFSVSGKLEFSHLHIANRMNVIFHLSEPGAIDSAAAYSTSPLTQATRIIIGDPLLLRFTVRWYSTTGLPHMSDGHPPEDVFRIPTPIIILIIIIGLLAAASATMWKRKGKRGNPMGGIIGNVVGTGNGKGAYGSGGYGDTGYSGFKGVSVRGGSSGSNGYGYGGFSGKRKD